ncbi:phosphoribosyltransferase-like protein [Melampsora americana]|nr:phosphoribosyltransferase-like protein [Melampsora americana]
MSSNTNSDKQTTQDKLAELKSNTTKLISLAITHDILRFGNFTLKSGRSSPYFYNAGLYNSGLLLNAIGLSYAMKIISLKSVLQFDVLFGPAYKGIPLATITAVELARLDPLTYGSVGVAYNRKEAKTHGEGGRIVGVPLKNKRVLILDDVITAGTAIRQSIDLIKEQEGTFVGVVVNLDRQEKAPDSEMSAIQLLEAEHGVRVYPVINLTDIIEAMKSTGGLEEHLESMELYRKKWGINQN